MESRYKRTTWPETGEYGTFYVSLLVKRFGRGKMYVVTVHNEKEDLRECQLFDDYEPAKEFARQVREDIKNNIKY